MEYCNRSNERLPALVINSVCSLGESLSKLALPPARACAILSKLPDGILLSNILLFILLIAPIQNTEPKCDTKKTGWDKQPEYNCNCINNSPQ